MHQQYEPIRRLLERVRARYRAVALCQAVVRAALLASAVIGISLLAVSVAPMAVRSPLALAAFAALALLVAVAAAGWALLPLLDRPSLSVKLMRVRSS